MAVAPMVGGARGLVGQPTRLGIAHGVMWGSVRAFDGLVLGETDRSLIMLTSKSAIIEVPFTGIESHHALGQRVVLPDELVRQYKVKKEAQATRALEAESASLARAGYLMTDRQWVPGKYRTVDWIGGLVLVLFFVGIFILLMLIGTKPAGTLTVTFTRAAAAESQDT